LLEIPNGCGKSHISVILALYIHEVMKCKVVILNPNEFLNTYAQEFYGIKLGIYTSGDKIVQWSKNYFLENGVSEL
jgi:hypothetical protein